MRGAVGFVYFTAPRLNLNCVTPKARKMRRMGSELNPDSAPRPARRARRIERRVLDRKFPAHCGKGPNDERSGGGEPSRPELRGREVLAVEQIIDLGEELQPLGNLIARAEIDDSIAWRPAGPEIIQTVGLMQVVFITARVRARNPAFAIAAPAYPPISA